MFNRTLAGFSQGKAIGDGLFKEGVTKNKHAGAIGAGIGAVMGIIADYSAYKNQEKVAEAEFKLTQTRNNIVFKEMASALADNARVLAAKRKQTADALYNNNREHTKQQALSAAQIAAVGMAGASYEMISKEYDRQKERADERVMSNYETEYLQIQDQGRSIINGAVNQTVGYDYKPGVQSLDASALVDAAIGVKDLYGQIRGTSAKPTTGTDSLSFSGNGLAPVGQQRYGLQLSSKLGLG